MNIAAIPALAAPSGHAPADTHAALRKLAKEFEAQFVAEMLKHSGLNGVSEDFGGGHGEDAFASFLTETYAQKIVEAGGIGLSESIFRALVATGEKA